MYESPSLVWQQPQLEVLPMARAEAQNGQSFIGTFGQGYEHRLVWTYGFQNDKAHERWKMTVDAATGEVLAMEDTNHYLEAKIKGGIYPSTNTGVCPATRTAAPCSRTRRCRGRTRAWRRRTTSPTARASTTGPRGVAHHHAGR